MYFIVVVLRRILGGFFETDSVWFLHEGETLCAQRLAVFFHPPVFQAGVVCNDRTKLLCSSSDSTTAPSVLAGTLFTCHVTGEPLMFVSLIAAT